MATGMRCLEVTQEAPGRMCTRDLESASLAAASILIKCPNPGLLPWTKSSHVTRVSLAGLTSSKIKKRDRDRQTQRETERERCRQRGLVEAFGKEGQPPLAGGTMFVE